MVKMEQVFAVNTFVAIFLSEFGGLGESRKEWRTGSESENRFLQ